jgi:hypothetical protein
MALTIHALRVSCLLSLSMILGLSPAYSADSSSKSNGSSGKDSSSKSDKSDSSSDSNGDKGGGGGFAIESEMFSYRALTGNSKAIAADIAKIAKDKNKDKILIVEDADLKNYLAMRSFVAQSRLLTERAEAQVAAAKDIKDVEIPKFSEPAQPSNRENQHGANNREHQEFIFPPGTFGMTASDALGNIQTGVGIIKDLASLFAVNHAISGLQGNIKDVALVNMVGRQLRAKGITVLIPSA